MTEKEAAKIKALRESLLNNLLIDPDPLLIEENWSNEKWLKFFIPYYIKSAWRGKARLTGLIIFGLIILKALNDISKLAPVLWWPTLILFGIISVWLYISALRCAFNGSYKWLGT